MSAGRRTLRVAVLASTLVLLGSGLVPASASPAGRVGAPAGQDGIDSSLVRTTHNGQSTVIFGSGRYLTPQSSKPAARVALDYVRTHRNEFGLSPRAAAALEVTDDVVTGHDGAHHVVIGQRVRGLPVDGAVVTALVDSDGRLVLAGGRTGEIRTSGAPRLTAGDAIRIAAQRAGASTSRAPRDSHTRKPGKHTFPNPYAKGLRQPTPVSAELVWRLRDDRSLRLVWRTDVEVSASAWHATVVDAATGEVLARENRYRQSGPRGDVFTEQHPGVAGATQQVVPFAGIDGSWVTGTATSGNNVNAYLDRDNSNANDEYQPTEADQHFDYTFTDAWRTTADTESIAALDADRDVAVTQLFYYVNDMHDWLYRHGFDEGSGNFQVDNFGRGGTGSDPVLAESQNGYAFGCSDKDTNPNESPDDRCRNNANLATTPDGTSPRMQMYMFIPPGQPFRDASMDGDVVAHEYGHGVSTRLVPGGLSNKTNQAGSLGEGWSDTVSFLRWGDATVGEYVTSDPNGGIRTSSYDVHPDTYGDYRLAVSSPHRNGEIWAATMYDIRETLGLNAATIRLVLDGMRSTPNGPTPTFLDARDGILAADMASTGGASQCALWSVFASHGMGTGAASNGLHAVPTEDFTVPAACLPTADANGPYTTDEGTDAVLDASGSQKGTDASAGEILSYEWDLDNDGSYDDATGQSPRFDHVGQDQERTVGLRVTDEYGNTDTVPATVTVRNVAPTVSVDTISPTDEHGTVTVSGTIRDPGWLDPLTATVDFDDGNGTRPLSGKLENTRPDGTFTFSVGKQYGDNGIFTVTVTGSDDDTSRVGSEDAVLANINPTASIDTSNTEVYGEVSAFVLGAGEDLTVPVHAADPGSDDLTFGWDWGDGTSTSETSLVNPPNADQPKSPTVQPRDVMLDATHGFDGACLYDLAANLTDDDGGTAAKRAAVVVTGNAERSKGSGWWLNQYRSKPPNRFSGAELECYLDIVNFFSPVFSGVDRAGAEHILHNPAKDNAKTVFDQQAMAAWLNFANGAVGLDTMVDTTGDDVPDTTFGDAMLTAETVRLSGTQAEIREQKDIVERIVLRDQE